MVTFSCCMIVKNEANVLARCLDSIKDLMDEIIIVDTGSTDNTKEIAALYTDKIYDFAWCDDFSEARNFSFSKASMDYIYCPDADEYLDEENQHQLSLLKQYIDLEIEIVQMMYNTVGDDTVLNIKNEYRPKLFKQVRTFKWVDPVHETVRLEPVVFNSDIVITHEPESNHAKRDFSIFKKAIELDDNLSDKVISMYATELLKQGNLDDLSEAVSFFIKIIETSEDQLLALQAKCVLVRFTRLAGDVSSMNAFISSTNENEASELNYDFGLFLMGQQKYEEALHWLKAAAHNASYCLDIHTQGDFALNRIIDCLRHIDNSAEEILEYNDLLIEWHLPEEDAI